MFNFLIHTANAAGTLTSATTSAIIQSGVDNILENLIDNFPKILLPMIVIGAFFTIAFWFVKQGKKL